jgi:hypothetical protein
MMGMLVKREGLWFKILIAKYGMEDGRILGGCSKVSRWWRDLNCVRGGVDVSIGTDGLIITLSNCR